LVNYDPVDKTVLANEQVDANGRSWRSGAKVEKKMLKQWFFKISAFREELLKDLDVLAKDGAWPERILTMQKNWLGKSTGARIKFRITTSHSQTLRDVEVFTTRPDTLFGVQYVALASNHPIIQELAATDTALLSFLDGIPSLPEDSKAGYLLPSVWAHNPLLSGKDTAGCTVDPLPVYVAPYVLGDYGDGAVMGVPGHDARDHAFWKNNRGTDQIKTVISPLVPQSKPASKHQPYIAHGKLTSNCGPFAGQCSAEATKSIVNLLQQNGMGSAAETWRLRDWLISRQRYWGTPIPIIHCEACGPVPVPDDQLPVQLPSVEGHWKAGKVGNPLEDAHDWVNTSCPNCRGAAKRDTDTMDTFVDSSWYFMRFLDPKNNRLPFSPDIADNTLPVDIYVGGVEHAILHLLYARFISKFLATTGLWKSTNRGEPFKKILAQGMVHGRTFSDPSTGRFLKPDEMHFPVPMQGVIKATGEIANVSFEKMSKSKYNGVDPGTCMAKHGADATRAHILFQAPVSEVLEWDEDKILGVTRWLQRLIKHLHILQPAWVHVPKDATPKKWFLDSENFQSVSQLGVPVQTHEAWNNTLEPIIENDKKLWRAVQTTIRSVTRSYGDTHSLNTVVSDLMSLTNSIIDHGNAKVPYSISSGILSLHACKALIQMMAPITPAFSEECWTLLHRETKAIYFPKKGGFLDSLIATVVSTRNPISYMLSIWFERQSMAAGHKQPAVLLNIRIPRLEIRRRLRSTIPSVFDFPFPEQDGTLSMLTPKTQSCAVQVNGKTKLVVEIPIPPGNTTGDLLETWIIQEIYKTKEGIAKLNGKLDVKQAKKVIVVKNGKTVNFVM
jgi:leucyl-tRNA synthetase